MVIETNLNQGSVDYGEPKKGFPLYQSPLILPSLQGNPKGMS